MTLFPPISFAVVEDGVYRSGVPDAINYEFLRSLHLKSVVILSPNILDEAVQSFFEQEGVVVHHVGKSVSDIMLQGLYPITEEVITDALKIIASSSNHPLLLICKTGKSVTSVAVACLRKLQRWSLISIFEEYRRFAGGSRLQPQHEQFIELYDTELIEINDASPEYLRR